MDHHHRAGPLKQQNKARKNRFSSKGEVKRKAGGKLQGGGGTSRSGVKSSSHRVRAGKNQRFQRAQQIKLQKREQVWLRKRLGSGKGAPKIVALIALSSNADLANIRTGLLRLASNHIYTDTTTSVAGGGTDKHAQGQIGSPVTASYSQLKMRITIFEAPCPTNLLSVLDIAKVADLIVWVLPLHHGVEKSVDEVGESVLSAVKSQGLPTSLCLAQGVTGADGGHTAKQQKDLKRFAQRFFETEFGACSTNKGKVVDDGNYMHLLRAVAQTPTRQLHWRSQRSYFLALNASFLPDASSSAVRFSNDTGVLSVSGYLRGCPLSPNQLIHLTGKGTFKIKAIRTSVGADPCPLNKTSTSASSAAEGEGKGDVALHPEDDKVDSLTMEASPDLTMGEQSLITDEELAGSTWQGDMEFEGMEEDDGSGMGSGWGMQDDSVDSDKRATENKDEKKKKGKARPKGMSEYQAAWLVDDGETKDAYQYDSEEEWTSGAEDEDQEEEEEEELTAEEVEEARRRAEDEQAEFPDEVEVPDNQQGKVRFARYRGLESFRTAYWDPLEQLPDDYGYIWTFKDFKCTQKRVLQQAVGVAHLEGELRARGHKGPSKKNIQGTDASGDGMDTSSSSTSTTQEHGPTSNALTFSVPVPNPDAEADSAGACYQYVHTDCYVTLELDEVPLDLFGVTETSEHAHNTRMPLLVSALHPLENKLSVIHLAMQKQKAVVDTPVKSKDPLVAHIGFRRFNCRPSISEHNLNSDKSRFCRFMPQEGFHIATVYAPITFGKPPALLTTGSSAAGKLVEGGAAMAVSTATMDTGNSLGVTTGVRIELMATGSVLAVDPRRIILKRVILTGYPVKVKKRNATIKYMFQDPEDIEWFKPVELNTKWGLTGHISEPLGTHGLFKATFSKPIKQNDTVCLALYKRVYPRKVEMDYAACDRTNNAGTGD